MRCGGGLANWEGTCEECIATLEEYPCAEGSNFADGVCDCRCEVGFDDCEDLSKRPEPALVMCGQTTLAFDFYNQEATCDLCSIDTAPLPPTVTELPQGCEQPGKRKKKREKKTTALPFFIHHSILLFSFF